MAARMAVSCGNRKKAAWTGEQNGAPQTFRPEDGSHMRDEHAQALVSTRRQAVVMQDGW